MEKWHRWVHSPWHPSSPPEHDPLLPRNEDEHVHPRDGGQQDYYLQGASPDKIVAEGYGFKLASTMLNFVTSGIAMTGIGALLPEIEYFYDVNDSTVALVFPAVVAGYIVSTLTTQYIHLRSGRRGVAWVASITRILSAAILSTGPPFWGSLISYFVFGIGTGLTDSGWCAWASDLPCPNIAQGMLHGSFALGSVSGPFVVIALLRKSFHWFVFYRFIASMLLLELIVQSWSFRNDSAARYTLAFGGHYTQQHFSAFQTKFTWICGLFYLVYIGIEASFSDWIVVYMQRTRDAAPTVSRLASSIFWIGMSIGRFALGLVTELCGLEGSMIIYIASSTLLELAFRFTTNVGVSLVLLGANGFFCGPMFPSALLLLTKSLPQHCHVGAVAAAAVMGQVGGGIVPLGVGFMADKLGIHHLLDVVLILSVMMLLIWMVFSRLMKRHVL